MAKDTNTSGSATPGISQTVINNKRNLKLKKDFDGNLISSESIDKVEAVRVSVSLLEPINVNIPEGAQSVLFNEIVGFKGSVQAKINGSNLITVKSGLKFGPFVNLLQEVVIVPSLDSGLTTLSEIELIFYV